MREAERRRATYYAEAITNGYLLTEDMVGLLERARVTRLQVTIDGVGAAHDATRHLAGSGPTFRRIADNLRRPGLPFFVSVRHNVHGGNVGEAQDVRSFVEGLAAESGNTIAFYPALVKDNVTAERRGRQVGIVDESCGADVLLSNLLHDTGVHFIHCGASHLFDLGIDAEGNLYKCWEAVDKPHLSFGRARDWDPRDPLATADRPDNLTCFLNQAHARWRAVS